MLIIDKPYKIEEERKNTRVSEIKDYARKEMRHIRTGIKDEFKEEHYNALIYNICELLDELEPKAMDIITDCLGDMNLTEYEIDKKDLRKIVKLYLKYKPMIEEMENKEE